MGANISTPPPPSLEVKTGTDDPWYANDKRFLRNLDQTLATTNGYVTGAYLLYLAGETQETPISGSLYGRSIDSGLCIWCVDRHNDMGVTMIAEYIKLFPPHLYHHISISNRDGIWDYLQDNADIIVSDRIADAIDIVFTFTPYLESTYTKRVSVVMMSCTHFRQLTPPSEWRTALASPTTNRDHLLVYEDSPERVESRSMQGFLSRTDWKRYGLMYGPEDDVFGEKEETAPDFSRNCRVMVMNGGGYEDYSDSLHHRRVQLNTDSFLTHNLGYDEYTLTLWHMVEYIMLGYSIEWSENMIARLNSVFSSRHDDPSEWVNVVMDTYINYNKAGGYFQEELDNIPINTRLKEIPLVSSGGEFNVLSEDDWYVVLDQRRKEYGIETFQEEFSRREKEKRRDTEIMEAQTRRNQEMIRNLEEKKGKETQDFTPRWVKLCMDIEDSGDVWLLAELITFRNTMTGILANSYGANYRFETTGIDTPEVVCRELAEIMKIYKDWKERTVPKCINHSDLQLSPFEDLGFGNIWVLPVKDSRGEDVGTYHCFSAEDISQLDTNPYSREAIPEYLKRYVTGLLDVIRGFYDGVEEEEKELNTHQKDREITSRLYSASYDFDMSLYDTMVDNDPNLVGVFGVQLSEHLGESYRTVSGPDDMINRIYRDTGENNTTNQLFIIQTFVRVYMVESVDNVL
jgi:hypothetical protein